MCALLVKVNAAHRKRAREGVSVNRNAVFCFNHCGSCLTIFTLYQIISKQTLEISSSRGRGCLFPPYADLGARANEGQEYRKSESEICLHRFTCFMTLSIICHSSLLLTAALSDVLSPFSSVSVQSYPHVGVHASVCESSIVLLDCNHPFLAIWRVGKRGCVPSFVFGCCSSVSESLCDGSLRSLPSRLPSRAGSEPGPVSGSGSEAVHLFASIPLRRSC